MTKNKQIILVGPNADWGTESDRDSHIALVHPEIPANTGNIARLCAGAGAVLHLVKPLGFVLEDRYLRRAGLDYWPRVTLCVHPDWDSFSAIFPQERMHFMTTRGSHPYTEVAHEAGGVYIFGRESRGLEPEILAAHQDRHYRIPIKEGVRSLNLANACAIVIYDVKRRQGFTTMQ